MKTGLGAWLGGGALSSMHEALGFIPSTEKLKQEIVEDS